MRRLTYIVVVALFLLISCKTKTDVTNPDIELVVSTQVLGATKSGVRLLLFNNLADYTLATITNSSAKAIDSGYSVNGTYTFHNLNTTSTYRILATWTDTTTLDAYTNIGDNYLLANTLNTNSITYVTVDLKTTDGYAGFWGASNIPLPMHIAISSTNSTLDTVKVVLRSYSLTGKQPSVLEILQYKRVNLGPGSYTYYAYDSLDTYFNIGSFTIDTGSTSWVQLLPDTALGLLSFYFEDAGNENSVDLYPITVNIDHGDSLGAISGPTASATVTCGSPRTANIITAARAKGAHTYNASSANGLYRWQGSFTITSSCTLIPLE